jgi:hypothetical protein
MQQPNPKGGLLGWISGSASGVLTRKQIIDALDDEDRKSVISTATKQFIYRIIVPYLNTVRDEPQHLATILVGIINVIYLNCDPDSYHISSPSYKSDNSKPIIPRYPNIDDFRSQWDKIYGEWWNRVEPMKREQCGYTLSDKPVDFATFEECILAAIPENGTVFYTNPRIFTQLQALARKYIVSEQPEKQSDNSIELSVMRPTR